VACGKTKLRGNLGDGNRRLIGRLHGQVPQIRRWGFIGRGLSIGFFFSGMTSKTLYPAFGLESRVPSFLSRFYRISDDENGAAEYPDLFTHDVTFQFTSIRMSGIAGTHSAASQLTFREQKASGNHVGGKHSASACGGKGVFV